LTRFGRRRRGKRGGIVASYIGNHAAPWKTKGCDPATLQFKTGLTLGDALAGRCSRCRGCPGGRSIARGGGNTAPYSTFTTTVATIRFRGGSHCFRTVLVGQVPLTRRRVVGQQCRSTRGTIARGGLAHFGIVLQGANIRRGRWSGQCFVGVARDIRLEAALWHTHKGLSIRIVGIGPDAVLIQARGTRSGSGTDLWCHHGFSFLRFYLQCRAIRSATAEQIAKAIGTARLKFRMPLTLGNAVGLDRGGTGAAILQVAGGTAALAAHNGAATRLLVGRVAIDNVANVRGGKGRVGIGNTITRGIGNGTARLVATGKGTRGGKGWDPSTTLFNAVEARIGGTIERYNAAAARLSQRNFG
jgi:hypothetical protein